MITGKWLPILPREVDNFWVFRNYFLCYQWTPISFTDENKKGNPLKIYHNKLHVHLTRRSSFQNI